MNKEIFKQYYLGQFIEEKKEESIRRAVIEQCRQMTRLDVYDWIADAEIKNRNLEEENQQLKEQLKQKDEVIEKAINWLEEYKKDWSGDEVELDIICLLNILKKYKGDNNKENK